MQGAIIAPTQLLKKYATQGDIHLVLAHLVGVDTEYSTFYSQQKKFKILDNGVFENGVSVSTFELLHKAALIEANEIVMPDVLGSGEETYNKAIAFLEEVSVFVESSEYAGQLRSYMKTVKFMGVPQSKSGDVAEYLNCLSKMLLHPQIHTIGLSILGVPNAFAPKAEFKEGFCPITHSRTYLLSLLHSQGLLAKAKKLKKQFHLLGMGSYFDDLYLGSELGIRSNDTSSPVVHGLAGVSYKRKGLPEGKIAEKLDFQKEYTIGKRTHMQIARNIATYKQVIK